MSITFRIRCCLCRKNIPLAQDVYELDAEWQRRFPNMASTLACQGCAMHTSWICAPRGTYPDGHIPASRQSSAGDCIDAWSHVSAPGTHRAQVVVSPRSGLLQGAEPYLRSVAARKGTSAEVAARLRAVLQEWDEQRGGIDASHAVTS